MRVDFLKAGRMRTSTPAMRSILFFCLHFGRWGVFFPDLIPCGDDAAHVGDHFIDDGKIFKREFFALILSEKDVAKLQKIFQKRLDVVGPALFVLQFRLDAPTSSKFFRADFALLPLRC